MVRFAKINDLITDKISGEWGEEVNGTPAVNVLRTTNFTNQGSLNLQSIVKRNVSADLIAKKKLSKGDVIIEKSGGSPTQPVGRVVYFDLEGDDYLCNNFTAILRPSKEIFPKYFFYALYFLHLSKRTLKYQNKTTGILNLKLERYLEEEQIKVPDLNTQKQIAQLLEEADIARQKRKAASALTDEFLQSTFLSMFGDPIVNNKKWSKKFFKQICNIEKRAIAPDKIAKGSYYVGLEHIEKNSGELIGFLSTSEIELMSTKFCFTSKHILYGKLRPYLNKVCLPSIAGVCSTDILPIVPKQNIANKYFLAFLMRQPFFIEKVTTMSTGANLPRISPKILEEFKVICPPFSLQQKFASIVAATEQLRQKQKQSEIELENLFQALLQKYFE